MATRTKVISKDNGWNALKKRLSDANKFEVTVGIHAKEGSKKRKKSPITQVAVGTIHEFGAPSANIPERSFLRSTFDENRGKYIKTLETGIRRTVKRKFNVKSAFILLGEQVIRDIHRKIQSRIPPPLAEATVTKGNRADTPLFNTGSLFRSIKSKVTKKTGIL